MPLKKQTKPTLLELITTSEYRDSLVVKHYGDMTMAKAMDSPGMSIGRLEKTHGDEKIVPAIAKLFLGASIYFGDPFSQDMAEVVVRKLLIEYELRSTLKLADLVVICKEVVANEQFGKFTANKLLSHIKKYQKRRMQAAIDGSIKQSDQSKMYNMNLSDRIYANLKSEGKDLSGQVDRTRLDIRKNYK